METKDSYSFPLCHYLGQMARPIIASRCWIVIVLIVVILLYMPILFSGFYQDDYGHRLRFSPEVYEKLHQPDEADQRGPLTLYGFVRDSSRQYARDKGYAPWWASDHIRANFFRPLSSLTLAIDYSLWPDTPLLPHIHSLLWLCLLILLAYQLYRSISGSAVVAGISILLFAVDDVLIGPAGWISNRHALLAMVFCVLTTWLYHLGTSEKKWPYFAGAAGAYALALLASEMGVVTFIYLFTYLLVLDRDRWMGRIKRIIPFVLITVVWRLAYSGLGFGAKGSLLYVDPLYSPIEFITQLLGRYPTYLFSTVGLPVAGTLIAASPQATAWIAVSSFILLGLLVLIVHSVLKAHRTSTFWVIGLLCATVPLTSGIPGERNLGLVSLGVMGMMGQLLADVAAIKKPGPLKTFQVVLLKIAIPILLVTNLIIPLRAIVSEPDGIQARREMNDRLVNFGSDPALVEQHLYIINPPGTLFYVFGMHQRLFTDAPFPASINYLSSGYAPVHIERVDGRTIIVTPEGGYSPQPGPTINDKTGEVTHISEENVNRVLDGIFYNPQDPMQVGQVVALSEVTVKVTQMTNDGRVAQAALTFAQQLEDNRYVWLLWDEDTLTYERVQMPPIGESRVYPSHEAGDIGGRGDATMRPKPATGCISPAEMGWRDFGVHIAILTMAAQHPFSADRFALRARGG